MNCLFTDPVGHVSEEVVEAPDLRESAPFPVLVVAGDSVLATALDVQGGEIEAETLAGLL